MGQQNVQAKKVTMNELMMLVQNVSNLWRDTQSSRSFLLLSCVNIYQPQGSNTEVASLKMWIKNEGVKGATSRYFEKFFGTLKIVINWKETV